MMYFRSYWVQLDIYQEFEKSNTDRLDLDTSFGRVKLWLAHCTFPYIVVAEPLKTIETSQNCKKQAAQHNLNINLVFPDIL